MTTTYNSCNMKLVRSKILNHLLSDYNNLVIVLGRVSKFVAENIFNNVILNSTMNATMNLTNSDKGLKQNYLFSSGFLLL